MNYEQFVEMEVKRTEGSLAAMKNSEMFYCVARRCDFMQPKCG